MAASFKLEGTKRMKAKIDRIARDFPDAMAAALKIEAELIMAASKKHYVPVDEGTLRNSGTVSDPERSGKDISVRLGFGGAADDYAVAVHETPSIHDPPTWRGKEVKFGPGERGRKYLEKPLLAAIDGSPEPGGGGGGGMAERIAARVEERVRKAAESG